MDTKNPPQYKEYRCNRGDIPFPYAYCKTSDLRSWNMHDADQIIYSSEFRQLSDKIQLLPYEHPRRRTRLSHTLEVVRIATEIAKNLGLNPDLTEAIALGHDLGNSAFGEAGNILISNKYKIDHQELSYFAALVLSARKVDDNNAIISQIKKKGRKEPYELEIPNSKIKYKGAIIAETAIEFPIQPEVLDGIRKHTDRNSANSIDNMPLTLEGQVVRYADNFAYIVQDIDDAIRARLLSNTEYTAVKKQKGLNGKTWEEMREIDKYGDAELNEIYDTNVGNRVATLISRFVDYNNLRMLRKDSICMISSPYVEGGQIPVLEIDNDLRLVINSVWRFLKEKVYPHPRIRSTRKQYLRYMDCLINILEDEYELFMDCNKHLDEAIDKYYQKEEHLFRRLSLNPIFYEDKENNIKKAFILSRLSFADCMEVISKYKKSHLKQIYL